MKVKIGFQAENELEKELLKEVCLIKQYSLQKYEEVESKSMLVVEIPLSESTTTFEFLEKIRKQLPGFI